jgi:predicted amidohydrolase YtcJ
MKSLSFLAIAVFILAACSPSGSEPAPQTVEPAIVSSGIVADTVYTNGKIYTVNEAQPWAEAVAIKDGKFMVVGTNDDVAAVTGEGTIVVNLDGSMAMPGMIDLHHHLLTVADATSYLGLTNADDADAMLAQIKEYAQANPDMPVVRGEQWNLGVFPNDSPTKELLDEIVPNRPAYFMSQSGHSAWVNSKALEIAGITEGTPTTDKFMYDTYDDSGEPSGTVREYAMAHVLQSLPKTPPEQMLQRIETMSADFAKAGYTSLKLAEGRPHQVKAAAMVEAQGKLSVRLFPSWEWESHYNEFTDEEMAEVIANWQDYQTDLIEPRYVKIFADGSPDSHTSLLYDDYADRPGFKGRTHRSKEALLEAVTEFNANGLGVITHVWGDATAGQVMDVYAEVRKGSGMNGAVLHLSHNAMTTVTDLEKFAKIEGVTVDFSPNLAYRHPITEGTWVPVIGEERYSSFYNVRSAIEAGLPVGFGTDYPSMLDPEINAFLHMQVWVTRVDPKKSGAEPLNLDQGITLEQAILGFTLGGAMSLGFDWPEKIGSIEEGKLADFVVLDRNILEAPISELYETTIVRTVVGGVVVHEAN